MPTPKAFASEIADSNDGCVRGKRLSHFHKRTDDEDAHLHRARTVQNVGGLKGTVLGEDIRTVTGPTSRL
jgi:hypothetical protein